MGKNKKTNIIYNDHTMHAHSSVFVAVKRGKIIRPSTCSECGSSKKIEGHHEDYKDKLNVVWLCRKCHCKRHPHPWKNDFSSFPSVIKAK
jgi:hypothetical protein